MMKKSTIILLIFGFVFSSLLFTASCAKKQVKEQEEIAMREAAERERAEAEARARREAAERERAEAEARARREAAERERAEAEARANQLRQEINTFETERIYFDFDKSELKPAAQETLTKKAAWLRANPNYNVNIEGHCDERGTNEYNLALGERRADAAENFLIALGVSRDRISTVSYGEERPADTGHNESAWSKNRRDEFGLIER